MKEVGGRKSDVGEGGWIGECRMKDVMGGSLVGDEIVEGMGEYKGGIFELKKEKVYKVRKVDGLVEGWNMGMRK